MIHSDTYGLGCYVEPVLIIWFAETHIPVNCLSHWTKGGERECDDGVATMNGLQTERMCGRTFGLGRDFKTVLIVSHPHARGTRYRNMIFRPQGDNLRLGCAVATV